MPDEFAHLDGRSLVSFAREAAGSIEWDTIDVGADGRVALYRVVDAMGGGGYPGPPKPPPPAALLTAIAALRAGKIRLLADGDETLRYAEDVVPLGLLRGRWRVYAGTDGEVWLRAIGADGREVGPTYFRPRFAAAVEPAVAEKTGTAGHPTSWHLVEAECRRRYDKGERHTGVVGESPTAWALVLLPWLQDTHPIHPPLSPKTARNNLSKLLRKLKKPEPEIGA